MLAARVWWALLCWWALQRHMPVSTIRLHDQSLEMNPKQDVTASLAILASPAVMGVLLVLGTAAVEGAAVMGAVLVVAGALVVIAGTGARAPGAGATPGQRPQLVWQYPMELI